SFLLNKDNEFSLSLNSSPLRKNNTLEIFQLSMSWNILPFFLDVSLKASVAPTAVPGKGQDYAPPQPKRTVAR
ncbi:hypothetical protein O1E46_RS22120, partial [Enterobacter hormaechei]